MIRLIQNFFSGCFHQWEVIDQVLTKFEFGWWQVRHETAIKYTLRCNKCGAMKIFLAKQS